MIMDVLLFVLDKWASLQVDVGCLQVVLILAFLSLLFWAACTNEC